MRIHHVPTDALVQSVRHHHGGAADAMVEAHPGEVHPAVRVHERTGHQALFLSPMYASSIEGLTKDDSDAVLARLHGLIEEPGVQVRWRWQTGDIAIWDETCTVHKALGDHWPRPRAVRRCTVDGGRPIAPGATFAR
jgi:taurine dioxygenase